MNERFISDLVFILVALIGAAILGFIIGYLLRKWKHSLALASLENQLTKLQGEHADCKLRLAECLQQKQEAVHVFDPDLARRYLKTNVTENDLKIVEGIGEKIEAILRSSGIKTWLQLAGTSAEEIKNILLTKGGLQYRIHEPETWPEQARLAHEGKWEQLRDLQDHLTGGRK